MKSNMTATFVLGMYVKLGAEKDYECAYEFLL